MEKKQNIGLLCGVFDPVHNGHLSVAMLALEFFKLDKILFVPSGTPPHKKAVRAEANDRMNMLKRALDGFPNCEIWDGEIHRIGFSYTVDTIKELRAIYPDAKFHFIIGSDNLPEIKKWYKAEEFIKELTLCIAERPGHMINISELLKMMSSADIKFFDGPMWGASSSLIREYMRGGHSCRYLLPDSVIEYIREVGLYVG